MLKIKEKNVVRFGHVFDYELENGELLHRTEWNGEYYETKNGIFRPVYKENEGDFEIVCFGKIRRKI